MISKLTLPLVQRSGGTPAAERDHLIQVGWKYEGVAWTAPQTGAPVYRVYNQNSGEHHYTMSAAEKSNLTNLGWKDEGIGWYSDTSKRVPLYRLYNPNAKGQFEAGGHHYTKSGVERNSLITVGWLFEGIAWYGVGTPEATVPIVTTPEAAKQYWLSATGNKYHTRPDCRNMNPVTARQVSYADAVRSYQPCSICN
ncbi:MAG: hypothetical protein ACK5MN_07600 [Lachnospiraceae bacterium]